MHRFLANVSPTKSAYFIVGDATGVDAIACAACEWYGWHFDRCVVNESIASPMRFWERNQRMATALTLLPREWRYCLAFPDDDARGTWDCVARCEKAGAAVHVCPLVDESGRVVRKYTRPVDGRRVLSVEPWKRQC